MTKDLTVTIDNKPPSELPTNSSAVISISYVNNSDISKDSTQDDEKSAGTREEEKPDVSGSKSLEDCDFETAMMETGYGKYNVLLLLASLPGFFGCLISTTSVSLVLPSAECDLSLTSFDMGLMNSISYVGMISCAFLWGFLSDVFGRKRVLITAFILDVILTVAFGMAQTFKFFIAAKLFSGFVNAGPYAILMTYVAESHASAYRASTMVGTGIIGSMGAIMLPALAWLIIPRPIDVSLFRGFIVLPSWRIFLLVCGIPSMVAAISLCFFDESPKFLMSRGRNEEALKAFRKIYRINTGKHPDTFPVKSLIKEVIEPKVTAGKNGKFAIFERGISQIKPLFMKPYMFNVVLVFGIYFLTLSALNTVRLWMPQLFSIMLVKEKIIADNPTPSTICELLNRETSNATVVTEYVKCTNKFVEPRIYINSIIIGAINGVGYLGSGFIVSVMEKRTLVVLLYIIAGCFSLGMYWSTNSNIMMGLTAVFLTVNSISSTTLLSIIVDLIPTAQRSMGVSLTMMFGRSGALVGNLIFAVLLKWNCTFLFFLISATVFGLYCFYKCNKTTDGYIENPILPTGSGGLSLLLPKTKGAALK